jgi:hypothetical protein
MKRWLVVVSSAILLAAASSRAVAQDQSKPTPPTAKDVCIFAGKEYSIGSTFCSAEGLYLVCYGPDQFAGQDTSTTLRTGPNGEMLNFAHWYRNTMTQCAKSQTKTAN